MRLRLKSCPFRCGSRASARSVFDSMIRLITGDRTGTPKQKPTAPESRYARMGVDLEQGELPDLQVDAQGQKQRTGEQ
jgi:hypothetical protein